MIDELVMVATAMEKANNVPTDWHPALTTIPTAPEKKPCFLIWLSLEGRVVDVEKLPNELIVKLWKYGPNNGSSLLD